MKAYRLVYFHITFKFQENKYKKNNVQTFYKTSKNNCTGYYYLH